MSTSNSVPVYLPPSTYTVPTGAGGSYVIYTVGQGFVFGGSVSGSTETTQVVAKKDPGCRCRKCKEFNEYAEPNQEDGSFLCYTCRKGY